MFLRGEAVPQFIAQQKGSIGNMALYKALMYRMSMKKYIVSILAFLFASLISPAYAAADAVTINPISTNGCGLQNMVFSGTATFVGQYSLVVTLDGTQILSTTDTSWLTPLTAVQPGSHTLTAVIASGDEGGSGASQTVTFTVGGCGGGDEKDCCPGPDPITLPQPTAGVCVKASSAGKMPALQRPAAGLNAEVIAITCDRIEVWYYAADGTKIFRKFHITPDTKMRGHIRAGSQVRIVFAKHSNLALAIRDRGPAGMEDVWGGVNNSR
jgi:hypothetical protein